MTFLSRIISVYCSGEPSFCTRVGCEAWRVACCWFGRCSVLYLGSSRLRSAVDQVTVLLHVRSPATSANAPSHCLFPSPSLLRRFALRTIKSAWEDPRPGSGVIVTQEPAFGWALQLTVLRTTLRSNTGQLLDSGTSHIVKIIEYSKNFSHHSI